MPGYPLKAVFLDKHGPNIVFNHTIGPDIIVSFINKHFDLDTKTGGYQI